MDGIEILCVFCDCGDNILVILLIVWSEINECVVGFDVGVDDYLIKLFEMDEFEVWLCVLFCCKDLLFVDVEKFGDLIFDCISC